MYDMVPQMLIAGATVGASSAFIVAQAAANGTSPSLGLQGLMLGGGVAAFVFFDRRERKAIAERNAERRAADEAREKELIALRAEVRQLNERIYRLLGGNGHP